ncbi:MAG: hypothetical protein KDD45_17030, partial [Bdellovibrionales bacterium]|nr:hypothetical protein [Bdellovibrionales bacterium]
MGIKQFSTFMTFVLLIIFFQNCSDIGTVKLINNSSSQEKSEDSSTVSGNGTGYGGKIQNVFYRYIPGFQCENSDSAFAAIEYNQENLSSIYKQSKETECLTNNAEISTILNADIDIGSMQHKVIAYKEGLYEIAPSNTISTPENLVEIWCVDQWEKPKVEVVSMYNISKKEAQTEFYFENLRKRIENNPLRSTSLQSVMLKSNYFNLIVDKKEIGLKPGTFQGRLMILENSKHEKILQCRLGSYLDANLWPAKVVNFNNNFQMEWNSVDKLFYLITGWGGLADFNNIEKDFYSYSPVKNVVGKIIEGSNGSRGVRKFHSLPNDSQFIMEAQLPGDITYQLYSKDKFNLNTPPKLLNNKAVDYGQAISNEISIAPNSQSIYYLDGAQETGSDIELWLRKVDLNSGIITQINQDIFKADEGVNEFDVSYSLDKVVYGVGFTYLNVWISDLNGLNRHQLDLSQELGVSSKSLYGGTQYFIEWYAKKAKHWFLKD